MAYAETVAKTLKEAGFRVKLDKRNEKLGFKIRDYTLKKVPYELIIGESEQANNTVSIRCVNGSQQSDLTLVDLVEKLQNEVNNKVIPDSESRYGLFQND